MAEPEINPLMAGLLQMVQGRQQSEVAKLTLLGTILEKQVLTNEKLDKIADILGELLERERAK